MNAGHRLWGVGVPLADIDRLIEFALCAANEERDWALAAYIRKMQERLAEAGEALVKAKPTGKENER